ncbi:intraflagellar transport protein 172 isoform X4 [Physcomitrium patens]|uniref:intraflagellar transport protein 172 isoform X4 n=1 Tax=Physcomitrium patens TaxID=3218 RepID=UPI003CCD085A
MNLQYVQSLLPSCNTIAKVTALAWAPNSQKLAAVTLHRIVHLFDENGNLKDKFSTKPADPKGSKVYIVTAMVFSPDSTKLAVGQSDDIIFVYKLGVEWGDKKSICNKFQQTSQVVSIVWPNQHQNELVFGLMDGKVKAGQLRTNRAIVVYSHGGGTGGGTTTATGGGGSAAAVVSLACSPDGSTCIAAHLDGSIYKFAVDAMLSGASAMKICQYGGVPSVLVWGESIVVSGSDCKVEFHDGNGGILQQFDYSTLPMVQEFSTACFNPSGDTVVLGSFNGFHVFSLTNQQGFWEDVGRIQVDNPYSISALAWKPDGSQLAVGGLCGNVDVFDACVRKERYKGTFEFTYVTKSQVIVKHLSSGTRIVIRSQYGWEILRINVYHVQYLIAHTSESLLIGNLETFKLSEVSWRGSGNEKFLVDNPSVCMIHNAGELSLVEYGCNEVLGTCRTEYLSPFLISVRLNDHLCRLSDPFNEDNKKIAYLIDLQTIRILDLVSGVTAGTLNHDCKIDWLELNPHATHLLFRDKKQQLHLFNLLTQERITLLCFCSYVQWVPDSDVVVAQNRGNLYVWYSIKNPEQATIFPIKGEVEGIERAEGRTEVLVDEGSSAVGYVLDEALIEFGMALEALAYDRAIAILEPLKLAPETEAMWKQLAEAALYHKELAVAERCYAALGDVSKARYVHKVSQAKDEVVQEVGIDGLDHYIVRAKLALLQHEWKVAETLLLEHGQVGKAIQMYTECHRWEEAISVAESQNHPDYASLKQGHYEWLLQTAQEEEAGKLKEVDGDVIGAITLFLKGGLPGHAADCVSNHTLYTFPDDIMESIANALMRANKFEKAGDFLEMLGKYERAKEAYKRGRAYRRAIDLTRRVFPGEVAALEEEWGGWLVSQNQVDAAINHFIEAGCIEKAIESAMASRQWTKAVQIVDAQDIKITIPFCERIARHFEAAKQYAEAEIFFVRAKLASEAVEMYIRANKWDAAHKVAAHHLSEPDAAALYLQRARQLEAVTHYTDAEKLYIEAQEPDLAIDMYNKARKFDHVIQLVSKYRQDALAETHLRIAQQLEREGCLRGAEMHYQGAQDWRSSVKMYTSNGLWEDALRVAKLFGGVPGSKQVAYAWAVSLGGDTGAQLLVKLGLVEQAIEYAMEAGAFEHAFDLCCVSLNHKLPEVQLKYAMFLEDEGRFRDAEDAFIKVGKPREAIDMYMHQQDWTAALRVADLCDPATISDVLVAQAQDMMKKEELQKAEALLIRAKRPDVAIIMYRDKMQWDDALRVAEYFLPSKVAEIHSDLAEYMQSQNGGEDSVESLLARGRALELSQNHSEAIDVYLQLDSSLLADFDKLQQVWSLAISLSKENVPERLLEVVSTVAGRLIEAELYEVAGELYEDINATKEATNMYIEAGLWEKARAIGASSGAPLQQHVDDLYKEHLIEKGDAAELVKLGHVSGAVEIYVQLGDWPKVHEVAALLGTDEEKNYSLRHAKECLQNGKCGEAIDVLSQHGVPLNCPAFELCSFAACKIISAVDSIPQIQFTMQKLREILFQIVSSLTLNRALCPEVLTELKRLLIIVNFVTLRYISVAQELQEMQAKLSISLLRYIGTIPADRAFYEAGMACKQLGWQNMAFVFLNRYLDIVEAIDDKQREEVRDWVIQLSMDQQIERALPTRSCEDCGSSIYVASLVCFVCKMESDMCCVTGYPVASEDRVTCKACKMPANKHNWNVYIHRCQTCPWCMVPQQPFY